MLDIKPTTGGNPNAVSFAQTKKTDHKTFTVPRVPSDLRFEKPLSRVEELLRSTYEFRLAGLVVDSANPSIVSSASSSSSLPPFFASSSFSVAMPIKGKQS
jgi:hypothetical protein